MLNFRPIQDSEFVVEEYIFQETPLNEYNNYIEKRVVNKTLRLAGIAAVILCTDSSAKPTLEKKIDDSIVVSNYLASTDGFFIDTESYYEPVHEIQNQDYGFEDRFSDIINDIISFQDLKNNWDGYGAYPLQNKSGVNSISILKQLENEIYNKIDDYYPNPSGTLSLIWKSSNSILELEIGDNEFSYYYNLNNSNNSKYFYAKDLNTNNIDELKLNISKVIENQ